MAAKHHAFGAHLPDFLRRPRVPRELGEGCAISPLARCGTCRERRRQDSQGGAGYPVVRPLVQLDEGELRRPVDRREQIDPTLLGVHIGNVEVGIGERLAVELNAKRLVALYLEQP